MPYKDPVKQYECHRKWRLENKEKMISYQKKYRDGNKETLAVAKRVYCAANGDRIARSRRAYLIEYTYGITVEQHEAIFESQGRRCANPECKTTDPGSKRGWHTDHDHETGKVRGLLCHHCNVALGNVQDSVDKLQGLIDYLKLPRE